MEKNNKPVVEIIANPQSLPSPGLVPAVPPPAAPEPQSSDQQAADGPPQPPQQATKKSREKFIIMGVFVSCMVVAALLVYFTLSGNKDKTTISSEPKMTGVKKFTIGYTIWPGYLGLYIARDKGFFTEEGLDVTVTLYPGFEALSTDYKKGSIQAKANLTLDAVKEQYDGLDHKAIIAVDYSNGADGIIARPGISKFTDIKGKKVAFEAGTLEEFFMRYALEQNNMVLSDIIPIDLDAQKSAEALSKGDVDVAVTYEPFLTKTATDIGGQKIFTSAQVPGLITDIITFRSDFIKANPDTVTAFVRAYFKGVTYWKEHPDEGNAIIAKELGVSKEEAIVQLLGINVLDKDDNKVAFTVNDGLQSLYGNMREIRKFVDNILNTKSSSPQASTDSLIDSEFINSF